MLMLNSNAENSPNKLKMYYKIYKKGKQKFPLNYKSGTTVPLWKLCGTFSVYSINE